MIRFRSFVEGIHQAVLAANETLAIENDKLFDRFFEKSDSENGESVITPKTVVVQCPKHTDDGIVMQGVQMPLITLAPQSMTQLEQVTLNVDLEMQLDGDEVCVGFQQKARRDKSTDGDDFSSDLPTAKLEIVMKPQETSEGLNILIEGYEKALRAQIPG